jgi:flagellar hook assembly protein FlgD
LHQNYPNPFNPTTNLSYELSADSYVTISVYDLLGNVVKNLVSEYQKSGIKSVQWDATNDYGHSVAAGVYLYRIESGPFTNTKKMILLK